MKIRIGGCQGLKQIELKSSRPCSTCTTGLCREHPQRPPEPGATPNLAAMKPKSTVGKKIKKTYDWMNVAGKPGQKASPVDLQAQTNPKQKASSQPENLISIATDDKPSNKAVEKKAKQLEARARNAAKKRSFQDALNESSGKAAIKKRKSDSESKTTSGNLSTVEVQPPTGVPSRSPTFAPPPPVKKPRKKAPPKKLDLRSSNASQPHRKSPSFLSNPTTSPASTVTPKSKAITSLSKLGAALESKLRSLGHSPTVLRSTLFSPSEVDRIAVLIHSEPTRPRRSTRLSPEAQAEAFLERLGRQMVGVDETVWAIAAKSPDPDELREFERVMMESPSPITTNDDRAPARAVHNGQGNGLVESSESEEE
jgi:hypothetical protein